MACVSGATLPIVHSLSSLDISTQNRSFNGALCEPSPSSSSFFSNPSKLLLSRKRRKRIILVHVASEILAYGHKECRRNDAPLKSNGWADEYLSTKRSSRVMREDRGDIPRVPCRRETRVVKVSAIHQSRGAKYTKFSYKSGGYNKANQGQKVDLLSGILSDDDPYQSSITRKRNPRVPLPTENQQSRLHNEVCPYESVKNPRAITKRADGHSSQRHASDDSSLSIKQHSLNFPMQRRETQPIPGKGALFMSKLETVLADLEVESDSLRGSFSDTTAGGEFRSASIDHSGDVFHDLTCQGKEQQVEETSQLTYAEGARSAELSDLGNSVHGRSLAAGEDDSIMIGHRKDLQNTNILYTQKLEKSAKVNDSGFIPFNLFPNLPSVPWEADRTYPSPPKNTHKKGMTSVRYAPTSIGSRSTPSQRSASKWGGNHPRFDSLLTSDLDDAAKFNKVGAKQSLLTDDILGQADMVRTLVASHKEKPSYIKHTRSYLKLDPEAVRSNTSALRSINGGKIMGSGSLVIGELQLKNKDKTIHQNGFQGTEKQVEDLDFESSDSDIKEDDHAYSDSDSVRDKDTASKPSKSVAGDTDNCPVAAGNMDGRIGNNSSANLAMDGKNSSNSSMIIAADGNVGVHHISDSKSLPTHATWQKHSMPDLPFDFQYSYTETPNAPVLKYRETPFSPFGPSTIGRPWIGGRPHNPSKKKKIVFDSFKPPPKDMKGVKHVQDPGPYPEGQGPKVARSREEIMGDPLTKEEIVYLVEKCKREKRQLNLGRDGLTHNMLDSIHSHWKRRRVCRIKCKGVPTVDMENVKFHIEDKTGGKIIYQTGGVLYLFRGRNYNYKDRPQIPLMLWKPATPVYPNLIQPAPEGLTAEEAKKLRKLGMKVRPICKLGKNGVYLDLVNEVKAAFKVDDLVRVDCQGLKPSDYKRIGAKLKDLVPCVLLSFEKEHILMWKGKEYSTDSRSEAPALEGTTDGDNKNFKLSVLLENPSKVESHFNANISVPLAVDLNPCCEPPHHSNLSYEEAHDRSVKPLDLAQNIEETGEENMSTDEDNEGDNSNPNTHQIIGELTSSIQSSLMNTSDNDAESLTTPSLRSSFNQAGHCSPDELMPSENRPSSDSVHQHEDYEDEPMLIGCPSDTSVHQQDCGDEEFALSEVPSMSITHHGKDLKGKKILVSEKSSSNDVMQDLIKEYGILARNKTLDEKIINDELTWMVDVNSLWEHALESGMAIEQKDMDPDLIIRKADELAQLAPLAPSYTTKLMYKLQIKRNSYTQLKDEPQIYFGRVLYKNKKPKKVKHKYELPTVGAPPIGRLPVDELAKYLVKKQASEAQGSESLSVPLC